MAETKIETKRNTIESARQNETFRDLDLDFIPHPATGDIVKKTGDAAIKRAIRNLLFLKAGELGFTPKGSGIHHQLFEPYTPATVEILRREIYSTLDAYEPRINAYEVYIEDDLDRNAINILINFEIINYNEPYSLSLFLERVR